MIVVAGISIITMGNMTIEQEDNPDPLWLDADAGMNIDSLAIATYGMATNRVLLDRFIAPIHTDSDETTLASWQDNDKANSDTWQDQDATVESGWIDADETASHTWT